MKKGVLSIASDDSRNEIPMCYLKVDESINVAIPSDTEFVVTKTVSAYDGRTNVSIFGTRILPPKEENLYDEVLQSLWAKYDKDKGSKHEDNRQVLEVINVIKPQDTVYFGFWDLDTNKPVVLPMYINTNENVESKFKKSGNNLLDLIREYAEDDDLEGNAFKLTKGQMGSWKLKKIKKLDKTQEESLNNVPKEIDLKVYESCMFKPSRETQIEDLSKFCHYFKVDTSSLSFYNKEEEIDGEELPF